MNAFEAVKAAVPVEDYAQTLTDLRPSGLRLIGCCPVPGHDERTPSFNIWTESGSWRCFGACARGGDVIDLCQAVEGGEPWEAMMTLATRYDVQLPERSQHWHDWQDEKGRQRKMLVDVIAESYRRRLFRCFKEELEGIEDPEERAQEANALWAELWKLSWLYAQWRVTS